MFAAQFASLAGISLAVVKGIGDVCTRAFGDAVFGDVGDDAPAEEKLLAGRTGSPRQAVDTGRPTTVAVAAAPRAAAADADFPDAAAAAAGRLRDH